MKINRGIISEFIFGSMDGTVSVLGLIIGLATSTNGKIVAAAIGLAAASAVSMAFGEYSGDDKRNIPNAIAMGIATLFGTMLPILPFILLPHFIAFFCAGVLTVGLGALIGFFRNQGKRGYIETYIMLTVAIGFTIIVTLLTGVGG